MSKFWIGFIIALPVGAIIGYFVAALCAASSRASRMEEEEERKMRKEAGLKTRAEIVTQGKPEDA